MKKFVEKDVTETPLYHNTWKLLKKYRDVVWSLEISVQHVRAKFEIEYGTSIEEFLDSVYLPLPSAAEECGGNHREPASAHPGHLLPHLLPQAAGGH